MYSCTLPPGTYYIGDPCYVFNDRDWKIICDNCLDDLGIIDIFKHKFFMEGTTYGDGTYHDNFGRSYPVDAGLIGAVPIELIAKKYMRDGMHFITFDKELPIEYAGGNFTFGDIIIKTRDDDFEEEEY
jgi:hypothetical protein